MSTKYLPLIDHGPKLGGIAYGDIVDSEQRIIKQVARGHLTAAGWKIVAIHAFNVEQGWSRDVTNDIARKAFGFICIEQDRWGMEAVDRSVVEFIAAQLGVKYQNAIEPRRVTA